MVSFRSAPEPGQGRLFTIGREHVRRDEDTRLGPAPEDQQNVDSSAPGQVQHFTVAIKREEDTPLGPAIQGVIFHKRVLEPEDQQKLNSAGSILSIICLPLKRAINIHDESQAVSRLWHAALDYISSLRGCEAIYWGSDLESELPAVLLLVQWSAASSWRTFQQSPGVAMISDMLRADPLNQTVRLHVSDIHGPDKIVEVTFLTLKFANDKNHIIQDLIKLHDLAVRTNGITSYAATAERYASWNPYSFPGRKLADEQPEVIVSLIVWDKKTYYAAFDNMSLHNAAKTMLSNTSAFSRYTSTLQHWTPESISTPPPRPKVCSTADLVRTQAFRRGRFSVGKGRDPYVGYLQQMAKPMPRHEEPSPWSSLRTRNRHPPLALDVFQINYKSGPTPSKQFTMPDDLADQLDRLKNDTNSNAAIREIQIARICLLDDENESLEEAGNPRTFLNDVFQLLVCEYRVTELLAATEGLLTLAVLHLVWKGSATESERESRKTQIVKAMEAVASVHGPIVVFEIPNVSCTFDPPGTPFRSYSLYELVSFDIPLGDEELFQNPWARFAR